MTALDVLSTIRQAGGSFAVEDGGLRIVVPRGLLTAEQREVLAGSKADLVRLLAPDADPERAAIRWLESLTPTEAAVVVETASREWAELVDADHNLGAWAEQQLSKPCEQSEQSEQRVDHILAVDADATWEQAVEPPSPCQRCGSLEVWWDGKGGTHCIACEPMARAQRIHDRAVRLRAKPTLLLSVKDRGKQAPKPKAEWPPSEYGLPATIEEIERGRSTAGKAQNLDDTRAGRIARLTRLTIGGPIADNAGVESRNAIEVLP